MKLRSMLRHLLAFAVVALVGFAVAPARAAAVGPVLDTSLRIDAMVRPVKARDRIRKQLEDENASPKPAEERELLYLLAAAATRIPDPATISDAQLRLHALGVAHNDVVALAYSEFIRGEQKTVVGDLDGGLAQILRAADSVRSQRDPRLQAMVQAQLCAGYMLAQQHRASRPHCDASVNAWRSTGDGFETGRALNLQGLSLQGAGDTMSAISSFQEARELFSRMGNAELVGLVGDNLAEAYSATGRFDLALGLSQESLRSELASGRAIHAMMSRKNMAVALLGLGRADEAWDEIQLAETAAWQNEYLQELPAILHAKAEIATRRGMQQEATRANQQAAALSRGSDSEYSASILQDLDARLRDREAALRVRQLEQEKSRRGLAFLIAAVTAAGFLVTAGLLWLLWRQQRRHAASMQALAHADALTGLANRRAVTLDFDRRLRQSQRSGKGFWVLLMDLDHFKRINDEAGHHAGDAVLQRTAAVLLDSARMDDIAGRIGGEEFVLLFDDLDAQAAFAFADRVRVAVMSTAMPELEGRMPVTISGGLARYPEDGDSWRALFTRADERLYRAKQSGRNIVIAHDDDT